MKEQELTFEQVKEILLLKDIRTIKSYVGKGLIPKVAIDEYGFTINAVFLAKEIGVENFDEPFISHEEAAKLLGISMVKLSLSFCQKKGLSFYRLRNGLNLELLFRKSDIVSFLQPKLESFPFEYAKIDRMRSFLETFGFFQSIESIMNEPEFKTKIFVAYLSGVELEEIGNMNQLTRERVRQVVNSLTRKTISKLNFVGKWIHALKEEGYLHIDPKNFTDYVNRLKKENERLSFQLKQCTCEVGETLKMSDEEERFSKLLATAIYDLDLSVRSCNGLKAARVETLKDLIDCTEADLMKYRYLGKKSLEEIKELLSGYNLSLKK
jgi:hypothetical protein